MCLFTYLLLAPPTRARGAPARAGALVMHGGGGEGSGRSRSSGGCNPHFWGWYPLLVKFSMRAERGGKVVFREFC